tara:strand:+ start:76 stop:291 length:216 start_codon:yes stop_codon:yes gene_type:complete
MGRMSYYCSACGFETPAVEVGVRVKSLGEYYFFETVKDMEEFLEEEFDNHLEFCRAVRGYFCWSEFDGEEE